MIEIDKFEEKLKPKDVTNEAQTPQEKTLDHTKQHTDRSLSDVDIAVRCLDYLAAWRADDYQGGGWLDTGMALDNAGATVADWDGWSQQSDKYKPGECARKWATFGKRNGRTVTVASLIDWAAKDAGLTRAELMQKINPVTRNATASPTEPGPWPDLIPLDEPVMPDFPSDALPCLLQDYVEGVAQSLEVPVDMPAVVALAVLGISAGGRYIVSPKLDWKEPVNLYSAVVSPPGTRKSAVHTEITRPLVEAEIAWRDAAKPKVIENQSQRRLLERKQKSLEERIAKGAKEDGLRADLDQVNKELSEFVDQHLPTLITSNATAEALAVLMSQNEGRLGLFSAEGGAFQIMTGLYSSGTPNLDPYLKAWSGDFLKVDRISREPTVVEHPSLSVGICIQPEVLAEMRRKSSALDGSGLLARFLFTMPQTWPSPSPNAAPVPEIARQHWIKCVSDIMHTQPVSRLILEKQASDRFFAFCLQIHSRFQEWGDLELIRPWAAKLSGQTLRIAALLHLVDVHGNFCEQISSQTMENAIQIAEYLAHHAKRVFTCMGADPDMVLAERIARWMRRGNIKRFGRGQLFNALRSRSIKKANQFDAPLELLADHGYVRPMPDTKPGPGRKAQSYEVNPRLDI